MNLFLVKTTPSKRLRGSSGDEEDEITDGPLSLNLVAALVNASQSSSQSAHHPSNSSSHAGASRLTPPESPTSPTPPAKSSRSASAHHLHTRVEIELPTLKEVMAMRSGSASQPSPTALQSTPQRSLKRMRSANSLVPQDEPSEYAHCTIKLSTSNSRSLKQGSEVTPTTKRLRSTSRLSQLRLHLLSSSAEKPSVLRIDNSSSGKQTLNPSRKEWFLFTERTHCQMILSLSPLGLGLSRPQIVPNEVLDCRVLAKLSFHPLSQDRQSLTITRVVVSDTASILNLGLLKSLALLFPDDSAQIHSSPIRGYVDRKLSRTVSASTAGSRRDPSDELQEAVQTAYGNLDVVTSLDAAQLANLRQMISALSSKLDDVITANNMRA